MSEASPERVRRARARGLVAVSHRLTVTVSVACALGLVGSSVSALRAMFARALQRAADTAELGVAAAVAIDARELWHDALAAVAPTLAASLLGFAFAHALQTRFLVAWPDDDEAGASAWEMLATALWTLSLVAVALGSAMSILRETGLAARSATELVRGLTAALSGVAWRVIAASIALGAAEWAWRRARYLEALRPTREEEISELREDAASARTRDARSQPGISTRAS